MLEFRETDLFTAQITALLSDHEYAELQGMLIVRPDAGDLIEDTGGLRKVRWGQRKRGKGKRGGIRVIYYWRASDALIYMLFAYSKEAQDDLSARQKKILAALVKKELT